MRIRLALGAALLVAIVVAGCSSHSTHSSAVTIPADADFNAADVAFATGMVPHHQQALAMADLVPGRDAGPAVTALARQIAAAQGPEIAAMSGWLTSWGQPLPMTMDMDHGSHDMTGMGSMDGMMTKAEMDRLAASNGATFDRQWVEMMIRHHEGAVTMAQREVAEGKFPASIALARSIIASQTAEIASMRTLLSSLPAR